MSHQPDTSPVVEAPRIEYDGRPLDSFDKTTLCAMIADLIAQLDAADVEVASLRREVERMRSATGKGFTRGR